MQLANIFFINVLICANPFFSKAKPKNIFWFISYISCLESEREEKSVCIQLEDIECELVFIDRPRTEISVSSFLTRDRTEQGTNAKKVISEVYAFFVMHCTVFGRKSKHKTDVTACRWIHFHKNNLWNILVIGNYYVNYQNYQN